MRIIYLIAIVSALSISCSNETNVHLQQINTLEKQVDSLLDVYNTIDFDHFKEMTTELSINVEFIKHNHSELDMQSREVSKYIGNYGALFKALTRTFKKGGSTIISEIEASKTQLENLKYDIKKELISQEEDIKKYVNSEKEIVELLVIKMNLIHNEFDRHEKEYDLLKDPVTEIIKEIKEHK